MVLIEQMCAGKEFQVEGADTEKARDSWLKGIALFVPGFDISTRISRRFIYRLLEPGN